ncbi:MAG: dTDP-glucose 4,6-dehydratase [Candidatus Margulisbacteria bacterium]|nr:dTDP-glucose 4,6-dehydratase [Candidatus Margulisiibacteriota bacterium]MBU1021503.1 dTDP-glucose 4,6-dehydratase [Candidatus Margulisiibacteriota bacterium]MBU1728588.1 dTDP-glucose 4,6-dehydratase [Candidatus Margulisiibacteriota bacterium]
MGAFKKVLVTGGAGFIGSNFVRHLLSLDGGYEVINLDKLTYAGNLENLKDVEKTPGYKFVKGDICDQKLINDLVESEKPDAIINFAAESHVDRSILSAGEFIQTDVFGTYVLLEAVKRFGAKRFIQIGTDEVYGSIEKGSFTEESPLSPNSPYASSKAGGDLIVRAYHKTFDLPVIITRSSNNYGPYQYPEKFIPLFITNAIEDKPLPLYGDGKNVRDWLYVEDNCKAIEVVLRKGVEGEIYNIGGEEERENLVVAQSIVKQLGKPKDSIKLVKDRAGHDRRYSLACEKVKKLGWKQSVSFEEGLAKTVAWYQKNQNWWDKIKQKKSDYQKFMNEYYLERA